MQKYIKEKVLENLRLAKNLTELVEIKNKILKELTSEIKNQLSQAKDHNLKKELGISINFIKKEIENDFLNIKDEIENSSENFNKDNTLNLNQLGIADIYYGKQNILEKTNKEILDIFKNLQFDIKSGNDIVSTFWNFDALNIPEDHPARASHDSFFINSLNILKTHNTSYSAFYINKQRDKSDIRICSYGPVYRKDDDDATHSHQFMQIDMVWVKEGLNIANLKWLVDFMLRKIFGKEIKTRYRLSFFPFTEPSFEVDINCFNCNGKGCNICKYTTWIEVLGAGVLHKNVLKNVGIDSNKYQGIAFGIGVERIAMLKYHVNDIREFYINNFDFLKQF